jgi:hypothetical protein
VQTLGSGIGLIGPVLLLLFWALAAFALYWVVRLAVRHGILDAHRRRLPPSHGPSDDDGPAPTT